MKLQLYVLRQIAVAFVVAAGGILFVALPGLAVGAVHRLAGVGSLAILKLLPIATAGFVPYVLPIAFLLALVATFGRLAADNEWTAIRMAGVNPYRMLLPALAFGALLSGVVYFMNSEVLPWLRYKEKSFLTSVLSDAIKNLSPGKTELAFDNFFLASKDRDQRDPRTFLDVFIEYPDPEVEGQTRSVFAERARFDFGDEYMHIWLRGARGVLMSDKVLGDEALIAVPLRQLLEESKEDYSSARYKRSGELLGMAERPDLSPRGRRKFIYNFHERIANALTCLMFVLLGVPTGLLMRRGTQLAALAVAVGYAILYWISSMRLGEGLGLSGVIPTEVAAWGPLALWTLAAALLTRKAFAQ